MGKGDIGGNFCNMRFGNRLVEEIRIRAGQPSCFEISKLLYKSLVTCKKLIENLRIKDEPLVDVGGYYIFYFKVVVGYPFPEVIKYQLM